jgi:anti-sigma-K factor RskA
MMRAHDESMLELAALRGIDALEPEEAALIDRHMFECAECCAEFARSRAAGTALALSASAPPPASLRERVLSSAVKIRRIRPWYRQTAVQAAAAAAVVLIAVGSWVVTHRTTEQQFAAKCTPSGLECGAVVASGGSLRLQAHGLHALPAGKVYQAWIIHPEQTPIPEPTFTVSNSGEGSVEMPGTPGKGDVVAVTIEPDGGSQAPSTKPVLVASLD